MLGMAAHGAHRHLVRAPVALLPLAVDLLGTGPALRRAHHDHRPDRALGKSIAPRLGLDVADLADHGFERGRHQLVHQRRLVPFDEMGLISVAAKQRFELLMADARQHRRVGDLVAVEMQDRQHGAVADRIEELVRMPARRQRPRLRFAVAHDRGDDEIGIVEGRAIGVRERIAELAALVDRAGRLGRDMAWNPAGKRELGEEPLHALLVLRHARIDFAVGSFEIGVGDQPRPAMAGAGDVDHVEIVLLDQPIEVGVDEVEARRRAPVPQESRLDVLLLERLAQQRIVEQIDLADRQIIGGPPVGVDQRGFVFRQHAFGFRRAFLFRRNGRHRHLLCRMTEPLHRPVPATYRSGQGSNRINAARSQLRDDLLAISLPLSHCVRSKSGPTHRRRLRPTRNRHVRRASPRR